MFKRRILGLLLAVTIPLLASAADKDMGPLTIVVPSAAGSAPDIIARMLGENLQVRLGRTVIVDNKPGAGGIVSVMAAKNGGPMNTLLLAQAAVVTVTPLTYRAAVYDMERDFEAIAVVAETPMMFVANPEKGPKTLAELVAVGRATPESLVLSSPARGSIPHLSGVLLGQMTDGKFINATMSGSGQGIQAVVSGDSLANVDGIAPLLPLVKAGRIRPLAVTASRVLPGLEQFRLAKDVVPGMTMSGWFMLFAPKGVPAGQVQALNTAVNQALKAPEFLKKLENTANYPVGGTVAEAKAFLSKEKKLWATAVQKAGLERE